MFFHVWASVVHVVLQVPAGLWLGRGFQHGFCAGFETSCSPGGCRAAVLPRCVLVCVYMSFAVISTFINLRTPNTSQVSQTLGFTDLIFVHYSWGITCYRYQRDVKSNCHRFNFILIYKYRYIILYNQCSSLSHEVLYFLNSF